MLEAYNAVLRLTESSKIRVEFYQYPSRSGKKTIYRGFGCVGGNLYAQVDAFGNVLPCSYLRGFLPASSLRQKSLKEIWMEGEAFKIMRSLPGNDFCLKCEFFKTCRGGCRARAICSGNIGVTDPACFRLLAPASQPAVLESRV